MREQEETPEAMVKILAVNNKDVFDVIFDYVCCLGNSEQNLSLDNFSVAATDSRNFISIQNC